MERIRLVETTAISNGNISNLPLNESKMVESIDGKVYQAIGAYTVPISRYDSLNKNNRIYSKRLWEHVISTQKDIYEGAAGLLDHPTSDPSVKDIFCVWHNLRLDESSKLVVADMYLCGAKGQDAKSFLDAGGKLELSSSGYGTIGRDGKTVEESSYQIERPADWVFEASQSVYATKEDEIKNENSPVVGEESVTNITENNDKELFPMSKLTEKVDLLRLKECESYLGGKFSEAEKEENLSEKKVIYTEIIDYCEGVPEFSKFSERAISAMQDLEKSYSEIEKEVKTIPSLKEEKENLLSENTILKEKVEKLVSFIEEARDACNYLKEEVTTLQEKNRTLEALYQQTEAEKNTLLTADEFLAIKEGYDKEKSDLADKVKELTEQLEKAENVREALILHLEKKEKVKEGEEEEEDSEEEDDKEMNEGTDSKEKDSDEELEEEEEDEEKEEACKKKESTSLKSEQQSFVESTGLHGSYSSPEVLEWYSNMLKMEEARDCVTKNKKELLSSPNLAEAIKKYRILNANSTFKKNSKFELNESFEEEDHFTQSFKPKQSGGMDAIIAKAREFHKGNFI